MDNRETTQLDPQLKAKPQGLAGWLSENGFSLLFVGLIAAMVVRYGIDPWQALKVALGLGFVIFIHELGHFLAAKWCDVHVQTFSIGFGPTIPGCSFQSGETTYKLGVFPLGGFVKMVGEGSETEEGEDDPRSFKNKTVGQRMLIISAGVIMNVLLAAACFIGVFTTTGVEKLAGVVGLVDSGSPSWQAGLPPGALMTRIGSVDNPHFDDVMPEVMHWRSGEPIPLDYSLNGKSNHVEISPRKNESTGRPMIGIAPARSLALINSERKKISPTVPGSSAAQAKPKFEPGDRIEGTSDPANPASIKPLPADPRDPGSDHRDYFEFTKRLQQLAGKEIQLAVRRLNGEQVTIAVPPAFHARFGLTLTMGPVAAIRKDSPAARAGVLAKDANQDGDILTAIDLPEADGKILRFTSAKRSQTPGNIRELPLDPMLLPTEVRRWAASNPAPGKKVKLTFERQIEHRERKEVALDLDWDDAWLDLRSSPSGMNSPLAIDELGLCYQVLAIVDSVDPGSSAAKAGIQKGDVVKAILFQEPAGDEPVNERWIDLEGNQAARPFYLLHEEFNARKVGLKLLRDKQTVEATLEATEDPTWPVAERGLVFQPDTRLQKADGFGQALMMGLKSVQKLVSQIYQNLLAMITGRVEFTKNANGPIAIAKVSYELAGENLSKFIFFLGMISINLAVINFLPIPVLDGGHMFFLLWEKLFGKPPPERIMVGAALVGIALIVSLMAFVSYLDLKR